MRKILSGFLATSMIVAVASSVSFASSDSFSFTPERFTVTPKITAATASSIDSMAAGDATVDVTLDSIYFDLKDAGTIEIPLNIKAPSKTVAFAAITTGAAASDATGPSTEIYTASEMRNLLLGKKFSSVRINGKLYSGSIVAKKNNSSDLVLQFNDETTAGLTDLEVTGSQWRLDTTVTFNTNNLNPVAADGSQVTFKQSTAVSGDRGGIIRESKGSGRELSDVERSGIFESGNFAIQDVIVCDGDGRPVPMTESGNGVDKDANGENGIQSGNTVYFMINDEVESTFADDTFWKLKVTKGDNSKMIKAISDVTKTFSKPLYSAYYGNQISSVDFSKRHRYIKVELNEVYTDDEYKITLDARLSPKTKAVEKFAAVSDDSEFKVKDFYFYMKNIVKAADNDWRVGIGGLMLNPLENDWNEVTYFDEDGDVAFMKFFADSDVGKFYSKLSTKWEHADYASYFNDQDAFIFNFTGSPKISSTSRCDLQIYNPFLDEDGNETIDPSTAVVYQVIDGDLYDVTDSFTYAEGENGDMAFTTRTRFLGTYIICEKAVEEAVADETVPDELTPDTDTTAPVETTPDNNGGGKTPANTGRYL